MKQQRTQEELEIAGLEAGMFNYDEYERSKMILAASELLVDTATMKNQKQYLLAQLQEANANFDLVLTSFEDTMSDEQQAEWYTALRKLDIKRRVYRKATKYNK